MSDAQESLAQHPEPLPRWLERFEPGDTFSRSDFFNSRVVFYPGSGHDGQPVARIKLICRAGERDILAGSALQPFEETGKA